VKARGDLAARFAIVGTSIQFLWVKAARQFARARVAAGIR